MHTVKRQKGIAAVMVALSILIAATVITFFIARVIATDYKIYKNSYDRTAAENAAEAGFSYALAYLNIPSTITDLTDTSTEGTDLYYNLPTQTLSNNTVFKASYRKNPDVNTLVIRSIGYSSNGTATDYSDRTAKVTIQAIVKRYSFVTSITVPVLSVGKITLDNDSFIKNTTWGSQKTVTSGNTLTFKSKNSATYYTNSSGVETLGSNQTGGIKSDITQNDVTMAGYTASTLETAYLGSRVTDFQSSATLYISCTGDAKFDKDSNDSHCTCNGIQCSKTGVPLVTGSANQVVYFNMNNKNLTLDNSFVLGSSSAPVTLVIANANLSTIKDSGTTGIQGSVYSDSALKLTGSAQVNGLVFTSADLRLEGNTVTPPSVTGAAIAGTTLDLKNKASVIYSATNLSNNSSSKEYGIVPGSWRDF